MIPATFPVEQHPAPPHAYPRAVVIEGPNGLRRIVSTAGRPLLNVAPPPLAVPARHQSPSERLDAEAAARDRDAQRERRRTERAMASQRAAERDAQRAQRMAERKAAQAAAARPEQQPSALRKRMQAVGLHERALAAMTGLSRSTVWVILAKPGRAGARQLVVEAIERAERAQAARRARRARRAQGAA